MAGDPTGHTTQWYLNLSGRATGPFSIEQLRSLIRDKQIPPNNPCTAHHLNGEWITVEEAIHAQGAAASAPKPAAVASEAVAPTAGFQPPPRPDVENAGDPVIVRSSDATDSLFDALQAARERKAKQQAASPAEESFLIEALRPKFSRTAMMVGAAGIAVLFLILVLGSIFTSKTGAPSKNQKETVKNFNAVIPPPPPNFGPKTDPRAQAQQGSNHGRDATHETTKPLGAPQGGNAVIDPRSMPKGPITPPPHFAGPAVKPPADRAPIEAQDNREEERAQPRFDTPPANQPPPPPPPPGEPGTPNFQQPNNGYPQQNGEYPQNPGYPQNNYQQQQQNYNGQPNQPAYGQPGGPQTDPNTGQPMDPGAQNPGGTPPPQQAPTTIE